MGIAQFVKYLTLCGIIVASATASNAGYELAIRIISDQTHYTYDPARFSGNDEASASARRTLQEIDTATQQIID